MDSTKVYTYWLRRSSVISTVWTYKSFMQEPLLNRRVSLSRLTKTLARHPIDGAVCLCMMEINARAGDVQHSTAITQSQMTSHRKCNDTFRTTSQNLNGAFQSQKRGQTPANGAIASQVGLTTSTCRRLWIT